MTLKEIIEMTGFSKPTIYRWIAHPRFRFPRPVNRPSKPALWDGDAVRQWWTENRHQCGLWGKGHNDK